MIKILLFLLLLCGISNAQIITFPDTNFKAQLLNANPGSQIAKDQFGNNIRIDANNDSQIQVSEAQMVYELNLSIFGPDFTNMTGILNFTNLKLLDFSSNHVQNVNLNGLDLETLGCGFCNLTTLDISNFPHLKNLSCGSNYLTSLNLAAVPLLETLTCRYNQLNVLDLQFVPNLHFLDCQNNHISTLNLSAIPNVTSLACDGNQLTTIDLSNVVHLISLGCGYNQFTNLNLNNVPSLENLTVSYSLLTLLDLSNVPNLQSLWFPNSQISNIDISNLIHLKNITCSNNLLTSLNLDGNPALEQLSCENNQISTITLSNTNTHLTQMNISNNPINSFNFANTPNLTYLNCSHNLFTTLNLNNILTLNQLDCSYNNNLTQLLIKNGRQESVVLNNNSNLAFICADEQQIVNVQSLLNTAGMNATVCTSYCSFDTGGNHNTIAGQATFDFDNNGCSGSDPHFPLIKFNITSGSSTVLGSSATNSLGMYTFYTLYSSNTIFPDVENPSWFNFSPTSATTNFPNSNNNNFIQDFCITANGVHNDLEIVLVSITPPRPGFNAEYQIVYKNKGNQVASGNVQFNYNDAVLDYITANVSPSLQSTGTMTWNYTNLMPFESRSIEVILNLNGPTETPPVNNGYVLNSSVTINPISGDEIPADNTLSLHQTVVGSYDPNDKTCLEGSIVSPSKIGEYLHYNINFENTGTAPATFIVVKDLIDTSKFDLNSLQVMHASHPMTTKITDNKIEFIFENINLGAGQHGNVIFKIKTKNTLVTGNTVTNKADIYFDYNFPVLTNTASTTFQALVNSDFDFDNSIVISPNPTSSLINIKSNSTIKSIQLYDAQGRLLQTSLENDVNAVIDISQKSNGIYFLKITSDKGSKVAKIVKE